MNNIYRMLLCIVVFFPLLAFSQADSFDYYQYIKEQDAHFNQLRQDAKSGEKIQGYKKYIRFRRFWDKRVYTRPDGTGSLSKYIEESSKAYKRQKSRSSSINYKWEAFAAGKLSHQRRGWTESIWVDTSNVNHILAGSYTGGLFKTTDGGRNWRNITESTDEPCLGIASIAVDPTNKNTIYIGTCHFWDGYGHGIWRTTNGGASWDQIRGEISLNHKIIIDPTDPKIIFAGADSLLIRSGDGGNSWETVYDFKGDYIVNDIVFQSKHSTKLAVAAKSGNDKIPPKLMIFDCVKDSTWKEKLKIKKVTPIYNGKYTKRMHKLAIDPQDSTRLYYAYFVDKETTGIREYNIKIESVKFDNTSEKCEEFSLYSQSLLDVSYHSLGFKFLPRKKKDHRLVVIGGHFNIIDLDDTVAVKDREFTFGGKVIDKYNTSDDSETKNWFPDLRCFFTAKSGDNTYVYIGNDGGICKYTVESKKMESLNGSGYNSNQFYSVLSNKAYPEIVLAGAQDNGRHFYYKGEYIHFNEERNWSDYNNMLQSNIDPAIIYATSNNSYFERSKDFGKDFSYSRVDWNWKSQLKLTESGSLIAVDDFLYIKRSKDEKFHKFTLADDLYKNKYTAFGITSDPNVLYVAFRGKKKSGEKDPFSNFYMKVKIKKSGDGIELEKGKRYELESSFKCSSISDIAVDPYNDNNFYLSLSGIWTSVPRVLNCKIENIKDTIISMDSCIQRWGASINIIKPIIINGKSTLILGSDLGIYIYNDNKWEQVNKNMPPSYILDLDINYTSGEIYAATFGRGLWKTKFMEPQEDLKTLIIDKEIIFDEIYNFGNKQFSNDNIFLDKQIEIVKGGKLIVKNTIRFDENYGIKIHPGGQLIVEKKGLLTSLKGSDKKWKGVTLAGNRRVGNSQVSKQPYVEINGGAIENAEVGINCGMGGIINSESGTIRNCRYCVGIGDYSYTSKARFKKTNFLIDDNYYGDSKPEALVFVEDIDGVEFEDCIFEDKSSYDLYYNNIHHVKGIKIENSSVVVKNKNKFTSSSQANFRNLEYGIYATTESPNPDIEVDKQSFKNCLFSVYLNNYKNSSITRNDMDVPFVPSLSFEVDRVMTYGLYLDGCTGYTVQENLFHGSYENGLGVYVLNSGRSSNEIYNNTYKDLYVGISAIGENRKSRSEGLCVKCNDFSGCKLDVNVAAEKKSGLIIGDIISVGVDDIAFPDHFRYSPERGSTSTNIGIAYNQGYFSNNTKDQAGNTFSKTSDVNIKNTAGYFLYVHHKKDDDFNLAPEEESKLSVQECEQTKYEKSKSCPSKLGRSDFIFDYIDIVREADTRERALTNELSNRVDGGNTSMLNNTVANAFSDDTYKVKNELDKSSPYLSERVVLSTIEREDLIPNPMVRDIIIKNPLVAKSDIVINSLTNRTLPMPSYMKDQILKARTATGAREKLESEIAAWKSVKSDAIKELCRYYKENEQIDKLEELLLNEKQVQNYYELIFISINSGDYNKARDLYNKIAIDFELTEREEYSYQRYQKLIDVVILMHSKSLKAKDLEEEKINVLKELCVMDQDAPGRYARSILLDADLIEYKEPIVLPDFSSNMKEAKITEDKTEENQLIQLYPNPAKDYIVVEYNTKAVGEMLLKLVDLKGNTIFTQIVDGQDQLTIDTRSYNAGTYILQILEGKTIAESIKVNIVK
ncbi:MAG: T9SS type A sorting domain-containing protein [Hyphomicrobiales bacterium]